MKKNAASIKIAEDHNSRSNHIKEIVQSENLKPVHKTSSRIPKLIIQFWHDHTNLPQDVYNCIESWKILETIGFERKLFDYEMARDFIEKEFSGIHLEAFDLCHHPAMQCDYFRLCYMYQNGGFYLDADELYQGEKIDNLFSDNRLKVQPLCYDLEHNKMISPNRFLLNKEFSSNWIFYLNNNPIITPKLHPVIELALKRATGILIKNKSIKNEIQETTGPGNLTASLVLHSLNLEKQEIDFQLITNWESISITPWPLSYRSDWRNWRLHKC